jgi:protein-disulfide isomerase
MNKGRSVVILFLFLLLGFFLVFYSLVIFEPFKKRSENVLVNQPASATLGTPTVTFIDQKRGNVRGTITLVEFGDYQCRYCAEMEKTINDALIAHPNLVLIWKDLPNVSLHKESQNAANAARCAGKQGKFWEYHDALFANQESLDATLYPQLAEQLGVNIGRFLSCMQNKEEEPVILRNVDEAIALGVDATPYFFLGSLRLSGQLTPADLNAALKAAEAQTVE